MKRSKFDLSEQRLFTADMGLLYPCFCRHVVPGDIFRLRNEVVVRMQPGRAPLMTDINIYSHYFFVPYRILDDNFEDFIRQSKGTRYDAEPYEFEPPLLDASGKNYPGDVLDFLYKVDGVKFSPDDYKVHSYPLQAYNMVYNEYYRDENLIDSVAYKVEKATSAQPVFSYDVGTAPTAGTASVNGLHRRAWEKDYFTSALPFAQRGIPPALPIFSQISPSDITSIIGTDSIRAFNSDERWNNKILQGNAAAANINAATLSLKDGATTYPTGSHFDFGVVANGSTVDIPAATFNVNDLRTAIAVQHWQELNARFGVRYTELLQAHFGVSPKDSRLDRPEYIGGTRQPLMVSEVLQTSESASTPQGSMTGHGISVNLDRIGSYRATEFGLIIGIFSILPRAQYMSGIDREWTYETCQEFYFPDFAFLGEQAVKNKELYASDYSDVAEATFGYQGRYDELRTGHDSVHSLMRTVYNYWSLARKFSQQPNLNQAFIECNPRKDFLFVQDEPGFIVSYANRVTAIRPMPKYAVPGLRRI